MALLAALGTGAIAATVIGYLCVRRDEIYFAMITLGFGMMLYTLAHNWLDLTGGSDGMPLMKVPAAESPRQRTVSSSIPAVMYLFVLAVDRLVHFFPLAGGPLPFRVYAHGDQGEQAALWRLWGPASRISGWRPLLLPVRLAGLAGGLFCLFNAMATPDFLHWSFSSRPVLMTILGGSGIFFGPLFGAAIFFRLEQVITNYTENWMIFLGLILIPVVLFFPHGILGSP